MLADPMSPDATTHQVNVIPVDFRIEYIPVPEKPGEFREVEKVDLVKRGSEHGDRTPWRISALKQDQIIWPAVEKAYEHWKKGQEEPVEGTPIDACPFIAKAVAAHLRNLHYRSVEDLALATDADLNRIGMGARVMREKARLYIDAKKGDARLADALAERDAENERLRGDIEELRNQVNELMADKPKRGPGRPPKQEAAE